MFVCKLEDLILLLFFPFLIATSILSRLLSWPLSCICYSRQKKKNKKKEKKKIPVVFLVCNKNVKPEIGSIKIFKV